MSEHEPGWLPDPYGRYQQRYWDGTAFTAHVITDTDQTVDPLGVTMSIPFAIPATALVKQTKLQGFLAPIGAKAHQRPQPVLTHALAGIGGVVIAAGVTALFMGDEFTRAKGIVAALLILGASLAVRLAVKLQAEARAVAVGAGAFGIILLVVALLNNSDSATGPLLLLALLFMAAWALPGFRGQPLMLGLGATFLVFALIAAVASNDTDSISSEGALGILPTSMLGTNTTEQGVVALLCAAALIGAVWFLDRSKYSGVATSLVPAGLIAATAGVTTLSSEIGETGGPFLATIVGLLICIVGSAGGRRATAWWGAAVTSIGAIAFLASLWEPNSIKSTGMMLVIAGGLLAVVPSWIHAARNSTPPPATNEAASAD